MNEQLVRQHFLTMWNKRDFDLADQIMATEYVEHAMAPFGSTEPGAVNGPDATRDTMQWLITQFPDIQMSIEAIVSKGDLVVVRVLSEGTNLGPLGGAGPVTGKRFSARQSHWFRVADGKLAEHWATRDDLTAMMQLGVVPAPGAGRGTVPSAEGPPLA